AATTLEGFAVGAVGFEPFAAEPQALPAEPQFTLDVVLVPKPGLRGVVRVAGGEPAAEARLVLRRPGERRWLGTTLSDSDGRFHLAWPGDEPLHLSAYHAQHGQARVDVAEAGEVVVELPGGAWIEGQVVDGDGDPVPAFSVTASPLTHMSGGPPAQSFDNGDGRFVLGPLAAGRMQLWAAAEGYQPGEVTGLTLEPGERRTGVVLTLKRSSVLTGRVTDARTGKPVAGASVIPAEWRARALAEAVGAYTDEDGRYTLRALPGVRTSIRITAEGYRSLLLGGVEGAPGEETVRDFELTPTDADRPTGELTGIGAVLRPHIYGVRLGQLVEGGPAAEVLNEGDVVVAVDGQSAKGLGMNKVAQAIRGEEGTEVVLTVRRNNGSGQPEEVVLVRGRVAFPQRHHN
ncbi:MAG: carboxypeptidase regulatory-like domain-containing protein, partial [Myxococcales bacterium]|nr:carboxypeptidase regulatory-like domain-containing protein [Myxococcales bacterium]